MPNTSGIERAYIKIDNPEVKLIIRMYNTRRGRRDVCKKMKHVVMLLRGSMRESDLGRDYLGRDARLASGAGRGD